MNSNFQIANTSTSQQHFYETQMAETVKKSRIVSEDDLEESVMQEFNMRLKHCMSQEKVQEETMENNEDEKAIYEEISSEQTNVYDIPKRITDSIYEAISPAKSYTNGFENGHGDQGLIYENVQDVRPILILPEEELPIVQDEVKSAKDRMLLSTDDTSCLLFTQTVTSPMLTPSEENIDFLKGFRAQTSQNTSETTSSSQNEEIEPDTDVNISDKLEIENENPNQNTTESDDATEPIYENLAELASKPIFTHGRVDVKAESQAFIDNEISHEETSRSECCEEDENSSQYNILDVCLQGNEKSKDNDDEDKIYLVPRQVEEAVESDELSMSLEEKEIIVGEEEENQQKGTKYEDEEEDGVQSESTETETIESKSDTQDLDEPPETEESNKTEGAASSSFDVEEKIIVDNPSKLVDALKTKYLSNAVSDLTKNNASLDKTELMELKTVDIMKQISKFESKSPSKEDLDSELDDSTEMSETSYVETTTTIASSATSTQDKSLKKKKSKKSRSHDKENISVSETNSGTNKCQEENFYNVNVKNLCRSFGDLTKIVDDFRSRETSCRDKSSFNKFDALQKKNVLHVRSSDSTKAQEKFNGATSIDSTNCKACGKVVFQMELIKAERSVWHKNCFRCQECNKQLTVDTYQSNDGAVYCNPHFKSLLAPKAVEDEAQAAPKKHELIIRENQPLELPPDVVRASDKPDLGLEELQSLNVRERFQVFEHFQGESNSTEKSPAAVNVKRSPSILSKLAKFQAKGMDVGVPIDSLNGIPIEESSSDAEEEEQEEVVDGEDADLIRAKRVQKEKPFHFTGMSDVKSKWEHGEQNSKDERREERKQEIQSIRTRLFMGKQGKMKEAYQQAVMESESGTNINKRPTTPPPAETCDTRSIKEKFEQGKVFSEEKQKETEDMSVFESGISKKSRSIFLELDANAAKAPQISPVQSPKQTEVKKTREAFLARQASEDTIKSSEQVDDVKIETADIQQRFKFFETYKEPEKARKQFRITPPREGQVKVASPEREVYRDPDVARAEEQVEDSVIAKQSHTATKVLNKFRQMEESLNKEPLPLGPKPLKRFTPPPEPARVESGSDADGSGSEEDSEEIDEIDQSKLQDADLIEAQKAARARQLRAKFEKWEAKEIKREQQQVNIIEDCGEQQGQIESTKVLRAKFESLKDSPNEVNRQPKVKVNRFVDTTSTLDVCEGCKERIYPLERITVHNQNYHKKCFKCMECGTILRMDSYTYNQGRLYCIPHFKRLFISKGNYDTAFGLEQHKEKWNTTVA